MKAATKKKVVAKKPVSKLTASVAVHLVAPPALGQAWAGQGGVFVGTVRGLDGEPDYHLVVGPKFDGRDTWDKVVAWAKKLSVDGHKDFALPNRRELRFLFCQAKDLHSDEVYWSGEQYAGNSAYAWGQGFDGGGQDGWDEGTKRCARAVRRVPIK